MLPSLTQVNARLVRRFFPILFALAFGVPLASFAQEEADGPGDREHERDDPGHTGAAARQHEPVGLLLALAAGLVVAALFDPCHRCTD